MIENSSRGITNAQEGTPVIPFLKAGMNQVD